MDEKESIEKLRETFKSGKTKGFAWRKSQLEALLKMVVEEEEKCFKALYEDVGKSKVEAFKDEVGPVKKSIQYALNCLKSWTSPKTAGIRLLFIPAKGQVVPEPYGLVMIMTSWNYPLGLALEPLIGAIAAGNVIVVKPSELAPATSSFLYKTIPMYLDGSAIKVIEGGAETSQRLLQHKWDKIFYTGSPRIGRVIMTEAAKHLTPVTLELGGKCPMIFDYDSVCSNLKVAMRRLASAKWGACGGQACIAIDYLIVQENCSSLLVEILKKTIKWLYGEDIETLGSRMSRIVNNHHFKRLNGMLQDPKVAASIVHGGSSDEKKLLIEPTILLNPPLDAEVMNEEIFGPILPIISVKNIEDSIEFINSRPKPLALYVFTNNESFKSRVVSETSSGSVTFNDVLIHYLCEELPFGGVGQSGMGRYHGKYSFDSFSHEKAVLRRGFFPDIGARYPPWNAFKLEFCRLGYNIDYINLILHLLGLRRYPRDY